MKTNIRGFTIVELFIVIVVIAVLAAITIVAFNGVQDRARKSALASEAAQTEKEIMSWALQKNGESVSLSNQLIGYRTSLGESLLLRPIVGAADITMYVAYDILSTSTSYNNIASLTPSTTSLQVFSMDTSLANTATLRYRIDTSAQSNATVSQDSVRIAGTKVVGWLQSSNGATIRSFGYNRSSAFSSTGLTAHSSWNFTGLRTYNETGGITLAALVFSGAHDQATRAQVLGWLAEKYNISVTL